MSSWVNPSCRLLSSLLCCMKSARSLRDLLHSYRYGMGHTKVWVSSHRHQKQTARHDQHHRLRGKNGGVRDGVQLQVALDMGAVKRSMLEWSLTDICRERAGSAGGLPMMPRTFISLAQHASAFHRLLLAELHAGIKQVRLMLWHYPAAGTSATSQCMQAQLCRHQAGVIDAVTPPAAAGISTTSQYLQAQIRRLLQLVLDASKVTSHLTTCVPCQQHYIACRGPSGQDAH